MEGLCMSIGGDLNNSAKDLCGGAAGCALEFKKLHMHIELEPLPAVEEAAGKVAGVAIE